MKILAPLVVVALFVGPGGLPLWLAAADPSAWRGLCDDAARLSALLRTTLLLAAGAAATALPIGAAAGTAVFRLSTWGRRPAQLVLVLSALTPIVLYAAGWQAWIGPVGFIATGAASSASVGGELAAAFLHGLWAAPWVALIVGIGVLRIDPAWEEAALLDAPPGAVLRRVTLRLARPAVVLAGLAAAASVLTEMTITDLFAVRSFAEEVYTQFEVGESEHVVALASLLLSLLVASCLMVAFNRSLESASENRILRWPRTVVTRTWLLLTCLLLATFLAPAAGMAWQVGLAESAGAPTHWSLHVASHYLKTEIAESAHCFLESSLLASAAASIAVASATIFAWEWRQGSPIRRRLLTWLVAWLWVLPGPVLAVAMIEFFNRPGLAGEFYDSRALVIYAMAIRSVPFATFLLIDSTAHLRAEHFEASAIAGATPTQQFQWIALPLLRPSMLLAWLIAFASSANDLSAVKMLAPPGVDTLPMRIFHLLHTGAGNEQSALGLLMIGWSAIVAGCVIAAARWAVQRRLPLETRE